MKGFPAPPPPNSLSLRPQPTGRTSFCQQAPVLETPSLLESPAFSKDTLAQMFSAGSSAKESFNGTEESVAEPPRPRSNPEKAPSAPQPTTHEEDVVAILRRVRAKQSEHVVGVTFDELVDRLVSQHMSRQDTNFQEVFLCLYRKFAAPGELLAAIVQRFEHAGNDPSAHFLIKTTNQLRILNVLTMWIDTFPGDFASPQTSHRLDTFITKLSGDISFQAAAKDLRFQSENLVMVNDDTGWAHCDPDVGGAHDSFGHPLQGDHSATDVSSRMDTLTVASDEGTEMSSRRPSAVPSSFSQKTQSAEDLAPHPTYHTAEDYEIEARTMTPRQTLPLTKIRYHIFMDTPDDDFAEEMTRIDWVMFSSIRIRDLVRHVSLSLDEKEKCRSLANVNRTINHFNHIARWVSNMILMRDKAKHRAQMLEKFMRIASKMRIMNNYNGLGAVIAGINGSAIHRLSQTRALISPEVGKRFMRLELLMGNQKSHFAYRLAWENSPMPRIPFIPLHRRDLVSAEEGSRTFVGKEGEPMRINWRKFEVLGEVILPIMRSQMNGYGDLKRRDQARELILDCRMPCDEEVCWAFLLPPFLCLATSRTFWKCLGVLEVMNEGII